MENEKIKLNKLRIFIDMDELMLKHVSGLTNKMKDLTDNIKVKLSTKVGDKDLGIHFIEIISQIDSLLKDYKELKDTWCVTPPSPALDDEK